MAIHILKHKIPIQGQHLIWVSKDEEFFQAEEKGGHSWWGKSLHKVTEVNAKHGVFCLGLWISIVLHNRIIRDTAPKQKGIGIWRVNQMGFEWMTSSNLTLSLMIKKLLLQQCPLHVALNVKKQNYHYSSYPRIP
jgi:hypothetical protein